MKYLSKMNIILIILIQVFYFADKSWAEPNLVFVSIAPQKFFVERIGGNEVRVEVMVNPGESPATFNPNPKKMSHLAYAKLYFSIGVPFEKVWISRIKSMQPKLKVISFWPDLIVGVALSALILKSSIEILRDAKLEMANHQST